MGAGGEGREWFEAEPASLAEPLNNLRWALDQMLAAVAEDRYRYEPVHVQADLRYLRGEVARAIRYRAPTAAIEPAESPEPTIGGVPGRSGGHEGGSGR